MVTQSTKPASEARGYLATFVLIGAALATGIWLSVHPRPHKTHPGFGPGWTCEQIDGEQEVCSRVAPTGSHTAP